MEKQEIEMHFYQEKKHTVRYKARLAGQAISDIYLSKGVLKNSAPQVIKLTVEASQQSEEEK